ncbi:hypothetical protein JEQ12_017722 [Ovis aries]|uniref:Uncharacterized protein n=1 Tax=Ovis aries TaxID=9940 RepID=A0A836ADP3_SHEEP|nr:hypothetical protein JEQ12_017722 [Ovis aries]
MNEMLALSLGAEFSVGLSVVERRILICAAFSSCVNTAGNLPVDSVDCWLVSFDRREGGCKAKTVKDSQNGKLFILYVCLTYHFNRFITQSFLSGSVKNHFQTRKWREGFLRSKLFSDNPFLLESFKHFGMTLSSRISGHRKGGPRSVRNGIVQQASNPRVLGTPAALEKSP